MSDVKNKRVVIYIDQAAAEDALGRLQTKADGFNNKIKDARTQQEKLLQKIKEVGEAGGSITKLQNQYDELGRKINGYNKDLKENQVATQNLKKQIDSGITPSFAQLERYVNKLRNELKQMSQDTPGYTKKFDAFKKASAQLGQLKDAMSSVDRAQTSWLKNAKSVAFGVLIGNTVQSALASLQGYLSGIISGNAKLSDSLSDIEKSTGLSSRAVKELNSELGKIDTRTKTADLREIAVGLGQIGEAANKANVAAIDKIVVALGDEFGGGAKEITTTLSVLRNNLSDIKTGDYATDVTMIGNALNTLGAEGLATAPVVTDIANRIAGIGRTFGLTSGQILGIAATFQELGIETERGSTAITKLFQKIGAEPEKFAKVAGIGTKEFKRLINDDMLAAFQAVADGAKQAGANNITFSKILKELDADGSGAGEVLSKLGANNELLATKVNTATTALRNQNSITDEFAKKNTNLAAELEKLSKKINSWFANSFLTDFFTSVIKGVNGAMPAVKSFTEQVDEQASSIINLQSNIVPLLPRYEELASKTNKSKIEQDEMKTIINQVAAAIPGAITQFDKYGNAIAISTSRVTEFIKNEKDRLRVVNQSAIEEQKNALKSAENEKAFFDKRAREIEKTGTFKVTETWSSVGGASNSRQRNATPAELQSQNKGLVEAASRVNGIRQEISRLNGDLLDATIKDQQKAKAAADAAAKEAAKNNNNLNDGLVGTVTDRKSKLDQAKEDYNRLIKEITDQLNKATMSDYQYSFNKIFELKKEQESKLQQSFKLGAINDKELAAGMDLIFKETSAKLNALDKSMDKKVDVSVTPNIIPEFDEKEIDDFFQQVSRQFKANKDKQADYNKDKISGLELVVKSAKSSQEILDAELALLEEKREQEVLFTDATGNEILLIHAKYDELEREAREKKKQRDLDDLAGYIEYGKQVLNVLSLFGDARNTRENKLHEADMRRIDQKKKKLQESSKSGLLTQQEYQIQIGKLDKEADDKKRALEQKQFERNRKIQIAQIFMNSSEAAIKLWAKPGFPANIPLLALLAAQTFAAIDNVNAQQPVFEKGGVAKGSRHSDGGINMVDSRSGRKVGEMEGGEPYMILSRDTYKNNKGIVDSLLYTSMHNGGAPIKPSWKTRPYSSIDYSGLSKAGLGRKYLADGGMFNSNQNVVGPNVPAEVIVHSDPELKLLMSMLMAKLDQPINAYISQKRLEDDQEVRYRVLNEARA